MFNSNEGTLAVEPSIELGQYCRRIQAVMVASHLLLYGGMAAGGGSFYGQHPGLPIKAFYFHVFQYAELDGGSKLAMNRI